MTRVCPSCNAQSTEGFRFCPHCGAAFEDAALQHELRKPVTVLFADVTGSTAIGERLDPEPLRRLMLLTALGWCLLDGPTPVPECMATCADLLAERTSDPLGEGTVRAFLACFLAMEGRSEEAREQVVRSRAAMQELGMATHAVLNGRAETMAGDLESGERNGRGGRRALARELRQLALRNRLDRPRARALRPGSSRRMPAGTR